jgi:hypothetical protein
MLAAMSIVLLEECGGEEAAVRQRSGDAGHDKPGRQTWVETNDRSGFSVRRHHI